MADTNTTSTTAGERLRDVINAQLADLSDFQTRLAEVSRRLNLGRPPHREISVERVEEMLQARRFTEQHAVALSRALKVDSDAFGDFRSPVRDDHFHRLLSLRRGATRGEDTPLVVSPADAAFRTVPGSTDSILHAFARHSSRAGLVIVPRALNPDAIAGHLQYTAGSSPLGFALRHGDLQGVPEHCSVLQALLDKHRWFIPPRWAAFLGIKTGTPATGDQTAGAVHALTLALDRGDYASIDEQLAPGLSRKEAGPEILKRLLSLDGGLAHTTIFTGADALREATRLLANTHSPARRVLVVGHRSPELESWISRPERNAADPVPGFVGQAPFFTARELADVLGSLITPRSNQGTKALEPLLAMPAVQAAIDAQVRADATATQVVAAIDAALRIELRAARGETPTADNATTEQGLI